MTQKLQPVLLTVSDEDAILESVHEELASRYSSHYKVIAESSAAAALETAREAVRSNGQVAVVFASVRMAEMPGVQFVNEVAALHPSAKRVLVAEYGDRSAWQAIQEPMTTGAIDAFAGVPQVSPDETFHRTVTDLLEEWARTEGEMIEVVQIIDEEMSPRSHRTRDLLERNGVPFGFYTTSSPEGMRLLEEAGVAPDQAPVLLLLDGRVLIDPSEQEVADALTGGDTPDWTVFEVAILGGGPAGLAAAIHAASEGLSTFVLEREAMGGQAGTTSMVRNYLGFPRGISGHELANRAAMQMFTFGVAVQFLRSAVSLERSEEDFVIELSDGVLVRARCVVLAPGVSYRRLGVPSLEALVGAGVYYGAAVTEAKTMRDKTVFVVGGGNSAGQAAVHLSKFARQVSVIVRDSSLAASMSDYLIRQMQARDNITVCLNTLVVGGGGERRLEYVELEDRNSARSTRSADGLFVLIGAEPHTDWLPSEIVRDQWGYVLTDSDVVADGGWSLDHQPHPFETGMPGVFAIGDVRHGSVKRVASAVGEGSVAILGIHRYLQSPGP